MGPLCNDFRRFPAPPFLAIVLGMADITIRLEKKQAERILKALGGLRFDEPTAEGDAVQDFLQTLSAKLFAADPRSERKAKG
jgi:hypothetical protein